MFTKTEVKITFQADTLFLESRTLFKKQDKFNTCQQLFIFSVGIYRKSYGFSIFIYFHDFRKRELCCCKFEFFFFIFVKQLHVVSQRHSQQTLTCNIEALPGKIKVSNDPNSIRKLFDLDRKISVVFLF